MIVFSDTWSYSVQGRKVDELLEFVQQFRNTHLREGKDLEDLDRVKHLLLEKICELNKKYPKTVKYYLYDDDDRLRIAPMGYLNRGIFIRMLSVKPFKEKTEQ